MKKLRTTLCTVLILTIIAAIFGIFSAGSSAAEAEPISHPDVTVRFVADGYYVLDQYTIAYGEKPVYKKDTVLRNDYFEYEIFGWTPEIVPATEDAVYHACYVKTLRNDEDAKAYLRGDANCDGSVDILDATTIQRYLVGLYDDPDEMIHILCACDGDEVTILDATRIQRFLAGFTNTFGIDKPVSWSEKVIPEVKPVEKPTAAPTVSPTEAPTEPETEAPTQPATQPPTQPPVPRPTSAPDPYELPPV